MAFSIRDRAGVCSACGRPLTHHYDVNNRFKNCARQPRVAPPPDTPAAPDDQRFPTDPTLHAGEQ